MQCENTGCQMYALNRDANSSVANHIVKEDHIIGSLSLPDS